MWLFQCPEGIAVLVVYVDDSVIGGPSVVVDYLISRFREYYILKVQDGSYLSILGMTVTTLIREDRLLVAFRMTNCIAKMYVDFCSGIGKRGPKKYSTPEWPENYDFGDLHEQKGSHQSIARIYIGRTLYVVRAVRYRDGDRDLG